jgi:integrase
MADAELLGHANPEDAPKVRQKRVGDKLSDRFVKSVTTAGRHSDGLGLYLKVEKSGSAQWIFMFRWKRPGVAGAGKLVEMGLGSLTKVSLKRAREKARDCRELLGDGKNPLDIRRAEEAIPTFGTLADEYVEAKTAKFKSRASRSRLTHALKEHAKTLRDIRVDAVTVDDVVAALEPIWSTQPEAAAKARIYIDAVLGMAEAKGHRTDNLVGFHNRVGRLLGDQVRSRTPHAALPYAQVPAFVAGLRERQGESMAALAHEFLILCASRLSEVRLSERSEFDLKAKVWTVPAAHMKSGKEHVVPLTDRAVEILEIAFARGGESTLAFPSETNGKPMSDTAFRKLRERMKVDEITTHGFRSSFRDWCGDATNFSREIAEAALSHRVGDTVEAAYRRGTALEKRRQVMTAWARYCGREAAGVTDMTEARKARS